METVLVAWLVVAAVLLGPPLLGVHRTEWPLRSTRSPDAGADVAGDADGDAPAGGAAPPAGRCRACGEAGQSGYTYCRSCLTPLPQHGAGPDADGREGHPAD